ncbi:MAG: AAA family ATPase [Ktedonobacteraceae bacterium]
MPSQKARQTPTTRKGLANMARLSLFCGFPFAGKTTLAKVFEQRFNFTRIDLDQIKSMFSVGCSGNPLFPAEWDRTYAESYRQLGEALRAGRSVVSDARTLPKPSGIPSEPWQRHTASHHRFSLLPSLSQRQRDSIAE